MSRRWISRSLLALLIAYQVALGVAWIAVDQTPPCWDEAWYLYHGARQYDALGRGDLAAWWDVWLTLDRNRPPLVPLLVVPFYLTAGVNPDAALGLNLACLAALGVLVYHLGRLAAGEGAGLMAAAIVGAYPLTIALSHIVLVELAMMTLVAASLLALWRTDAFGDRRWSVVAGALLGLGTLTKVFFPVFVLGPVLVTLVDALRRNRRLSWGERVQNAALMAATCGAVMACWYAPNAWSVVLRSLSAAVGDESALYGPDEPWLLRNLLAYLQGFAGRGLSWPGAFALVIGCGGVVAGALWPRPVDTCASPRRPRLLIAYLASSLLIGCAVFSSIRNQDLKHVSGVLSAAAVLSAWGLHVLAGRHRRFVAAVVLVGACVQSVALVLPGVAAAARERAVGWADQEGSRQPSPDCGLSGPRTAPDAREWPLRAVLDYALLVADLESLPGGRARVAVLPNAPSFEPYAITFEAYRHRMPADVEVANPKVMGSYDIVLAKTGCQGWPGSLEAIRRFQAALDHPGSGFHVMPRTYALPDGGSALVYARKPSPLLVDEPHPSVVMLCDVGGVARFLGCDADLASVQRGGDGNLEIAYYWQSVGPTDGDYAVFIHLIDPATGDIVAQDDHPLFAGTYPTSMWQYGRYLVDKRWMSVGELPSDGALTLRLGLYHEEVRLPVLRCDGAATAGGDHIDLRLVAGGSD